MGTTREYSQAALAHSLVFSPCQNSPVVSYIDLSLDELLLTSTTQFYYNSTASSYIVFYLRRWIIMISIIIILGEAYKLARLCMCSSYNVIFEERHSEKRTASLERTMYNVPKINDHFP